MAATANTSRSITPGVTIEMSDDEKYLCACHSSLSLHRSVSAMGSVSASAMS